MQLFVRDAFVKQCVSYALVTLLTSVNELGPIFYSAQIGLFRFKVGEQLIDTKCSVVFSNINTTYVTSASQQRQGELPLNFLCKYCNHVN